MTFLGLPRGRARELAGEMKNGQFDMSCPLIYRYESSTLCLPAFKVLDNEVISDKVLEVPTA